jgi:hypothetical protein
MQFIGEKQLRGVGIFLHFHATVIIVHLAVIPWNNRTAQLNRIPVEFEA